MKQPTTITDEDIDKLFENNDISAFKIDQEKENKIESSQEEYQFIPEEMDASKEKSIKYTDRPKYKATEEYQEKKKQEELQKRIKHDIEKNNDITFIEKTKVKSVDILNSVAEAVNKIKNDERNRQLEKQRILSGGSKLNFDPPTKCTYHVYQIREIMGNILFCACKYCSSYKEMTINEWDEYRYKNKKYL